MINFFKKIVEKELEKLSWGNWGSTTFAESG